MKNLNISVAGKIAKYLQRDGAIVCGNSDYQITFTFDTEWDSYPTKTARFIWNGKYWDQPFSGNVCTVPIITGATEVTVGVYAGELSTTTPASIPCKRSILCGTSTIQDEKVKEYRDEVIVAAERAEAAADRAEASGGSSSGGTTSNAPSYVINEAEAIADKVLAVRNANSFVMALASDLHTTGSDTSATSVLHAGQAMDVINSMTQLDLVALLGDYEVYYFDDAEADGEDARKSFKHAKKAFSSVAKGVPFMQLQGNHDQLKTDTTEEAQQKYYAFIGANNVGTVTDYNNKFRNYGYRDFENYKIRVIYLNTADVSEEEVTTDAKVSTEQLNWLNTVALNLTDPDWGIIVLTHHPLNWYGMTNLLNALDTYKGNNTGAKLIAHFHGHLHNFRAETLGTNAIPTITIPNAGGWDRENSYGTAKDADGNYVYSEEERSMYGDIDENGTQRKFQKTANSANDTAFNVIVIDRDNSLIHAFCYGAGIHRTITFGGEVTETEKEEIPSGDDNTNGDNTGTDTPDIPAGTYTETITGEFLDNTRLSTSGDETRTATGFVTTPYFDISKYPDGFTIKLSGIEWCTDGTSNVDGYAFHFYPNSGHAFASGYISNCNSLTSSGYAISCDGTTKEVTITTNSVLRRAYNKVRFSGKGTSANAVVQVIYTVD